MFEYGHCLFVRLRSGTPKAGMPSRLHKSHKSVTDKNQAKQFFNPFINHTSSFHLFLTFPHFKITHVRDHAVQVLHGSRSNTADFAIPRPSNAARTSQLRPWPIRCL